MRHCCSANAVMASLLLCCHSIDALNLGIRQRRKLLLVCICRAAAMLSHCMRRRTSGVHCNRCCSIQAVALAQSTSKCIGWRAMPSCRVSTCAAARASHEFMHMRQIFCSSTVCGLLPQSLDGEAPTRRAALMSSSASTKSCCARCACARLKSALTLLESACRTCNSMPAV